MVANQTRQQDKSCAEQAPGGGNQPTESGAERGRACAEVPPRPTRQAADFNARTRYIAHDLNNALAGLLGNAEMLKMDLEPEHPGHLFLDQIFTAAERARQLNQELHSLSAGDGAIQKQD
jgi:signal transduction histidine kinase